MATKGKTDELAKFFRPDTDTPEARPVKHPQHKNIVAFVGRLKYLWFMHERDRKDKEYSGLLLHVYSSVLDASAQFTWSDIEIIVKGKKVAFEPKDTLARRIEESL